MPLNAKASQNFVPVKEIQDGVVVLKDGGFRAILMASSINLSLKSEDEQTAILLQFQNFLNTLDFSVQISVQSRKFDITSYIALLEERLKEQAEPLLKIQTEEYIKFIKEFTESTNIMTKHFFLVIPLQPTKIGGTSGGGLLDKVLPKSKNLNVTQKEKDFSEERSQLEQRVALVQQGLSRMGIRTLQLKTEDEVELFYRVFNPGDAASAVDITQKEEKRVPEARKKSCRFCLKKFIKRRRSSFKIFWRRQP
jgi:type IV secretory pathway VirB4 component